MTTTEAEKPKVAEELAKLWGPIHALAAAGIGTAITLGALSSKTGGFLNKGLGASDVLISLAVGMISGIAPISATQVVARATTPLVSPIEGLVKGTVGSVGGLLGGILGGRG